MALIDKLKEVQGIQPKKPTPTKPKKPFQTTVSTYKPPVKPKPVGSGSATAQTGYSQAPRPVITPKPTPTPTPVVVPGADPNKGLILSDILKEGNNEEIMSALSSTQDNKTLQRTLQDIQTRVDRDIQDAKEAENNNSNLSSSIDRGYGVNTNLAETKALSTELAKQLAELDKSSEDVDRRTGDAIKSAVYNMFISGRGGDELRSLAGFTGGIDAGMDRAIDLQGQQALAQIYAQQEESQRDIDFQREQAKFDDMIRQQEVARQNAIRAQQTADDDRARVQAQEAETKSEIINLSNSIAGTYANIKDGIQTAANMLLLNDYIRRLSAIDPNNPMLAAILADEDLFPKPIVKDTKKGNTNKGGSNRLVDKYPGISQGTIDRLRLGTPGSVNNTPTKTGGISFGGRQF